MQPFLILIAPVLVLVASCGLSKDTDRGNTISGSLPHTTLTYDASSATLSVTGHEPSVTLFVSGSTKDGILISESASGPSVNQTGVSNLIIKSAGPVELGGITLSGSLSVSSGGATALGGSVTTGH